MISNSSMFTSTIFGNGSGKTAAELANDDRQAQEYYIWSRISNKMDITLPQSPSNQKVAKDK
tara:strand:- start:327 stop:512 length:186 start_codon:yes stop_codon:yes gene_type:complete